MKKLILFSLILNLFGVRQFIGPYITIPEESESLVESEPLVGKPSKFSPPSISPLKVLRDKLREKLDKAMKEQGNKT